ncbi:hypothetical protein LOTGIDRAFT_231075 [Lottia gigantea]|uniref:Sugar phosphate transporter domain-containing protein n=1 Tax=Lottia gigantea TaxID=225164 RepID=V4B078_LOTGI|nr:hypothetical protein LOTGIDRAFT_231075 [Lottia gigantea]ESO99426.1 hypothetical protein LOTGIDRAFT_231075 [Lottia gigantea]
MHPAIPISLLFVGCCSNVIFLELLVSQVPGCGSLVTMCQFLFITVEGFIFTTKFGSKKPVIPISYYLYMVAMFFVVQVINNIVFNFNIAMPLHMIFRSGTLAATMILGIFILKRQYKLSKYISVALITLGIIICTISSASQVESHPSKTGNLANDYFMWLIGIALLVFALFMSSLMGIFQEKTYKQFGKHPKEALFYNHALPLPMFLILSNNIYDSFQNFNQSESYKIPVLGSGIPILWAYLICYCLTQYLCISSVFVLTTELTSLKVTLIVTLRKFTSILISIWYFNNPFTIYHWVGSLLVFIGTLIFTELINIDSLLPISTSKKEV